uniref:Vacuolar protein sorting-associated protein 16 homolog n=1 Tax=Naja naja TaxID=35670 RepID=A0A8C7E383_NAJNA
MSWNLKDDLREYLVAAAPYGGPIALMKKKKEKSPSSRPVLEIYSASGIQLASVVWKDSPAMFLGWTTSEELLSVQENGIVLLHSLFGEFKKKVTMINDVVQERVLEARVFYTTYGTGLAILSALQHRFSLANNIYDMKLRKLPVVPGLQGPPSCWTVLCQNRVTNILLAVGQELYLLDDAAYNLVTLPGLSPHAGSFLRMAVSFNHRFLALFTDTGYVWMGRSNLKVRSKSQNSPASMGGCTRQHSRQRAVVMAWDRCLVVAGSDQQSIQYPLSEDSHLVPELDGVRIFSRSVHEFLHEIPEASEEIFKIASMSPGALLLEAQKEYEKESQKADEYLREIKDQKLLSEAVEQCIKAASYEHSPPIQKALLQAASFGKCFIDKFAPENFVETCRDLRVLNAVRDYQIGMPLSFDQYPFQMPCGLTLRPLCLRVVLRRLYPIAIKICEYLRLSEFQGISRILAHWACYKVQQRDKSDEELAQVINQKLGDAVGISYSDIATQAYESNRQELAIKLLEYEPRPGKQVPLLLTMKKSHLALSRAIESGDSDLVYTVISRLKDELGRGDFFMALQNQPVALSLYRQFCKHKEPNTLKDLYNQDDNHQELDSTCRICFLPQWIEGRVASLQNAVDEYYKAKNEFAAKATEDQIKLLRQQRRFQDEFDKPYVDLSLHDTVYNLILDGKHKFAEHLYRDFRIPDKRFWWLKISALAEQGAWEDLEKFSKSKRSPIGYLPFAEISMKYGSPGEAKKYAARVTPEQKVKAFLLVGDFSQAAEAAVERKNEAEMALILSKCTDASVVAKLEQAKAQLGKK